MNVRGLEIYGVKAANDGVVREGHLVGYVVRWMDLRWGLAIADMQLEDSYDGFGCRGGLDQLPRAVGPWGRRSHGGVGSASVS